MPKPPSFLEEFLSGGGDESDDTSMEAKQASLLSALPEDIRASIRYAQMLDRAKNGEAIYLMPFRLRIK
jgi:hypothetical protein